MTKYSIGPLHFEFSWSFEFRTRRHDRIFRVVDAYCRQNPNTDQLGHAAPIIEAQLYFPCGSVMGLQSAKELVAVIHQLQRRGYGRCLHEEIIEPDELWEFFSWTRANLYEEVKGEADWKYTIRLPPFTEPPDFYFEVYRWRNVGCWP